MTTTTNTTPDIIMSLIGGTFKVQFITGSATADDFIAAAAAAGLARHFAKVVETDGEFIECDETVSSVYPECEDDASFAFKFLLVEQPEEEEEKEDDTEEDEETEGAFRSLGVTFELTEGVDMHTITGGPLAPETKFDLWAHQEMTGEITILNKAKSEARFAERGGKVLQFESPLAYMVWKCIRQDERSEKIRRAHGRGILSIYKQALMAKAMSVDPTIAHLHLAQAMMVKFYRHTDMARKLAETGDMVLKLAPIEGWNAPYQKYVPAVLTELRACAKYNLEEIKKPAGEQNIEPPPCFEWLAIPSQTPLREIDRVIRAKVSRRMNILRND